MTNEQMSRNIIEHLATLPGGEGLCWHEVFGYLPDLSLNTADLRKLLEQVGKLEGFLFRLWSKCKRESPGSGNAVRKLDKILLNPELFLQAVHAWVEEVKE